MGVDGEARVLRVGEQASYVFFADISETTANSSYEVGALIRIEEEDGDWIRYTQSVLENQDCSF